MNVLLTGGFGTVGLAILDLLLERGHEVRVLDIRGRRTERAARAYAARGVEVAFGDIRDSGTVAAAVAGRDAVIHCAAILPPTSERNPELCRAINVGGTRAVVEATRRDPARPPLAYVSSASVMGPTQGRRPPVRASDPVNPTDAYARSKVEAEDLVRGAGIRHCILRLGAVMPRNLMNVLKQLELAFDIPLEARCELVLDLDVAAACVRAAELLREGGSIDGSIFFVGGGRRNGCQVKAREMYEGIFGPLGVEMPPASLFASDLDNYYIDWYETDEAQERLGFQNHAFAEYGGLLRSRYRALLPLIRLLRPLVSLYVRSRSPYRRRGRA